MPAAAGAHSIAFYSPVRGSGVTTLVAHLFAVAPQLREGITVLVDCDLEFPTLSAYFSTSPLGELSVSGFIPAINRGHCNLCKACEKACAFDAISLYHQMSYIHVESAHCRACGACLNTCRHGAITEQEREIAVWRSLDAGEGRVILEGELLSEDFFYIKALQASKEIGMGESLRLIDARGGLDYMSLEAMHGNGLLAMVIDVSLFEPEPYRQIVEYLQSLGQNLVVVVNRSAVVPESIRQFCHEHALPVAGCIPYDTTIPRDAVRGKLLDSQELFVNILRNLLSHDGKKMDLPK